MAVRRPRGWLGPAVLAFVVLFIVSMRQRLLDASAGTTAGGGTEAPPRTHWSSADLGVFPHHIPGEVSSPGSLGSSIKHRGLPRAQPWCMACAASFETPLLLILHRSAGSISDLQLFYTCRMRACMHSTPVSSMLL